MCQWYCLLDCETMQFGRYTSTSNLEELPASTFMVTYTFTPKTGKQLVSNHPPNYGITTQKTVIFRNSVSKLCTLSGILNIRQWKKSGNPIILAGTHQNQNSVQHPKYWNTGQWTQPWNPVVLNTVSSSHASPLSPMITQQTKPRNHVILKAASQILDNHMP